MKRRLSRKSRQKQKKFLIISSLSLLLFLCVGYAAFSTQLSIKATGHIKQKTASGMLRELCHTEVGDGLYKDIYEEGKCTYKGSNPNNYIEFNDEMWRIVSITSDDTIKIIKNDVIEGDFFYYEITEELNNYLQTIEKNKITNNNWHNLNKSEARVEFNLDLDKLIVVGSSVDITKENNYLVKELYDLIIKLTDKKSDGVVIFEPRELEKLGINYLVEDISLNHFKAGAKDNILNAYNRALKQNNK